MNNTDKPRIRWWGNGDVHIRCHNAFVECYPDANYSKITFRSDYIPLIPTSTRFKEISRITYE